MIFIILVSTIAFCFGLPTSVIAASIGQNGGVQTSQGNIEFLAYRTEPLDESRRSHSPIIFEGLKRNNGDYYDLSTGYFNAPNGGLYVFNFTSYATIEKRVRLMKNDYEIRILSKDGKGRSKAINTNVLLQLEGGDRVWLRYAHRKQKSNEQVIPNSTLTTFYGRLLTTDVHIVETLSSSGHHSRRPKRSSDDSDSLRRQIREANYPPVSLVDRGAQTRIPVNPGSGNYDVTGGSPEQKIAFSVTCTKSMIGAHMTDTTESLDGEMSPDAAPNGRIGFDKTFVNIGDGFDIDNAEFIAPTNGVYFFTYNVGKFPRKKLSVMLMKNVNEVQSIIYNDSKGRAREIQGQSLMLDLRKNDTIWLRTYNDKDYAVYSNFGNYITFSGYLVYSL